MKVILSNAFSLSMLPHKSSIVTVNEIGVGEVVKLLEQGFESAIGHESTATLLSKLLGLEVKPNRTAIVLDEDTRLVVFQLLTRLPEGAVLNEEELLQLLEQGKAKFYLVTVSSGQVI